MKFSLAILATLAAPLLVAASSQPSRLARDVSQLNPDSEPVANLVELAAAEAHQEPTISNAERLRRGLKVNPPTPAAAAKRHGPSAGATPSRTGNLQIRGVDSDVVYGIIGYELNKWGQYIVTTDADKALHCSFNQASGGSLFGMTASNNMFPSLPFIGAVAGFASQTTDMSSSSDYLFLGPSAQGLLDGGLAMISTAFGKAIGHDVVTQTSMWTYDVVKHTFGAFWLNAGAKVQYVTVFIKEYKTVALVRNIAAFKSKYNVDCVPVEIRLV